MTSVLSEEEKPKKVVLIGDGSCGKSCFLFRFTDNEFQEGYIPTIFENITKEYDLNGQKKELKIWDTAGQDDYSRIRVLAYPETDVCIIAFSIVSRVSFTNVENTWFPEYKEHMAKNGAKCLLIGTKCDLIEDEGALKDLQKSSGPKAKPISKSEGESLARKIKAVGYFETSSLTGQGVTEAFQAAIEAANRTEQTNDSNMCDCLPQFDPNMFKCPQINLPKCSYL